MGLSLSELSSTGSPSPSECYLSKQPLFKRLLSLVLTGGTPPPSGYGGVYWTYSHPFTHVNRPHFCWEKQGPPARGPRASRPYCDAN